MATMVSQSAKLGLLVITSCDEDGNYLVSHAMSRGKPFILVSMSYRLGYFGCLASEELKAEAKLMNEAGYANQGLNDQRLAIEWVINPNPMSTEFLSFVHCNRLGLTFPHRFRSIYNFLGETRQT